MILKTTVTATQNRLDHVKLRLKALAREQVNLQEEETLLRGLIDLYSRQDYDAISEESTVTKKLTRGGELAEERNEQVLAAIAEGYKTPREILQKCSHIPAGSMSGILAALVNSNKIDKEDLGVYVVRKGDRYEHI